MAFYQNKQKMRLSQLSFRIAGSIALVIAFLALTVTFTEAGRDKFKDLKRELRVALHLPKFWVREFNDDASQAVKVECPKGEAIVLVTGGQSNAANTGSDPNPGDVNARAMMFYKGSCYRLRDPVLGATGTGGSLWTTLGIALTKVTHRPVILINGAVGGTQLGDWNDPRSGYTARLIDELKSARSLGLKANFVLWVQGETDAYALTEPAEYVSSLETLTRAFEQAGFPTNQVPWIIYSSTRCMHRRGNGLEIDRAVTDFAMKHPGMILGPNATRLGDEYRSDGCHFNAAGRDLLVRETLPIVIAHMRLPISAAPQ